MKALGIFAILAVLFAAGLVRWSLGAQMSQATTLPSQSSQIKAADVPRPSESASATPKATATPSATATPLPDATTITMSFTSQAPLSNWDSLHEDTCEEASLLMVKYYVNNQAMPDKNAVDQTLIDWVHYEQSQGMGGSITLDQLNSVAAHYGLNGGQVIHNVSIDDIKRQVAAGHPVILGMAGKLLANPNFKNGGPNYHMLVVKGYDATGFITNDPGTRLGEGFHYDYDGFMNAIHNWNPNNILDGGRDMLVIK